MVMKRAAPRAAAGAAVAAAGPTGSAAGWLYTATITAARRAPSTSPLFFFSGAGASRLARHRYWCFSTVLDSARQRTVSSEVVSRSRQGSKDKVPEVKENRESSPASGASAAAAAPTRAGNSQAVSTTGGYRLVERLAKRIARSGLCSRREAERLIEQGLVSVDDVVVTSPAINVTPASVVKIKNKKLEKTPPPQLWLHYKKRGVLVTHHDPQGREALFPHLRRMGLPHLISVGRLDYTSEGLLLLTNNGNLAKYLEHPSNEFVRKYRVRIRGKVEQRVIDRLAQGITIGGVDYGPIKVNVIPKRGTEEQEGTNQWIYVSLKEGKNREIRRVFEHFKLVVTRLIRVQYGPYKLDTKLDPGDVVESKPRVDLIKKADKYWWLWDGDLEASRMPFSESHYRLLEHAKSLHVPLEAPARPSPDALPTRSADDAASNVATAALPETKEHE